MPGPAGEDKKYPQKWLGLVLFNIADCFYQLNNRPVIKVDEECADLLKWGNKSGWRILWRGKFSTKICCNVMMVRFRENAAGCWLAAAAVAAEHDLFFCRKRNIGGSLEECWLVPETGNLSLFASLEVECCSFTKKGIPFTLCNFAAIIFKNYMGRMLLTKHFCFILNGGIL